MLIVKYRDKEIKVSICGADRYVVRQNGKVVIGPVLNHILAERLLEAYSLKQGAKFYEDFDDFKQEEQDENNCSGCIYWRNERGCRFGELRRQSNK